jgi:peptidoglycan pentaglycine glycine transferase (the first glycine)
MPVTVRQWDDSVTWNRFVASLPNAHFQQSWEWGELALGFGVRPVRLAAMRRDEIVGAMQIAVTPLTGTGRTYLYVPRGPAVADARDGTLGPLLDAARSVGRESRSVGIRLEPNVSSMQCEWSSELKALGMHPTYPPGQPRSSWLLDITPDCDTLLAQMKQKTRYNVRLASKKGVEVSEGTHADLDGFYALYRETADRDDFFLQPKSVYERMFCLFREAGAFTMLLAHHHGELIAAVTLIRFGRTCWYLQGASSNQHRNLMATYLLQWEAIKRAKSWGCTLYDFRAVPDVLRPDQDMYGVYRFKEGFGGYRVTALDSYGAPYSRVAYGLWLLFFRGRFELDNWRRRRHGLPVRQSS